MKTIEDLKKKLHKEIEELAQKENFTAGDLETLYKLTCVKKNILTSEAMEMEAEGGEEEGYSQRGGGHGGRGGHGGGRGGGYSNEGGYSGEDYSYDEGGNSYRRGGRRSRDTMGRFKRRYSRDDGYSYHDGSEDMAEMMEDMMDDLPPDERQAAMRLLKRMRG